MDSTTKEEKLMKMIEDFSRPLFSPPFIPSSTKLTYIPHPPRSNQPIEPNQPTSLPPLTPGTILVTQVDSVPGSSNPDPQLLEPLRFFRIERPMLPPAGTAPSSKYPIVVPVPVTLGLFPDTYCTRQKNPLVFLIHASRNPFRTHREDVFEVLTADTSRAHSSLPLQNNALQSAYPHFPACSLRMPLLFPWDDPLLAQNRQLPPP
ncbi:hypothetical protein B9Z19DRAFT_1148128 [Tuber borchii]|uniref:Uncharacterized protein n=1 Tax=Tuber borchii TaxID=42251 RepID=A0A2T6ZMZ3_TUBBO|nr:hypothetical protein B9Z19DRAFT_1148128 [Tuber borchii]